MIRIIENKSSSYAPRTYANASAGHLTVAFAVDYSTAGERLTKKAAGSRYIDLPLSIERVDVDFEDNAQKLLDRVLNTQAQTLNIAGNGIYTLVRFGWDQEKLNRYIYEVLEYVHTRSHITHIYNGGQTGADIAGAVAADALGIDVTIHMPRGLIQRLEDGTDVNRNPKDIYNEVKAMASRIHTQGHTAPKM